MVYTCPRCNGPITDVAGLLACPTAPCQYGHDAERRLVPQEDPPFTVVPKLRLIGNFETFWKAYPRKVNKPTAKKIWERELFSPATLDKILVALEWQCRQEQWQDWTKIPHPSTYLNGRRWEDEPPTSFVAIPKAPPKSFKEEARERRNALLGAGVKRDQAALTDGGQ